MENRLIRPIVRIGNSSGVVLPRSWLNQTACVELIIKKSSDIFQEIIEILKEEIEFSKIIGIYLVGSYGRSEETLTSDIDILVITEDITKSIKTGIYSLILISKEKINESINKNAFPLLPMIKEAKPLLNAELLKEFNGLKLTRKNIKWHIETTILSMNENRGLINLTKELGEKNADDSIAYSLVLRLRVTYIIDCLKKGILWNNPKFLKLIKKIASSSKAYERYIYIKNDIGKNKSLLPINEAEKLLSYVEKKNRKQEQWSKELKD